MKLIRKELAVLTILLFIGLAFAPSIHANVSKEMVEFTTEVCGLDGGKHTVKLTREEAEEVDALFKSIRERLNETETREEAEEIFKEAVVGLDKYGLLGGLSIKQAQRLVTGGYQDSRIMRFLRKIYSRDIGFFENRNWFCLINGKTRNTYFTRMFLPRVLFFFPISIMNKILFGSITQCPLTGFISYNPSNGWVYTSGLNGVKSWDGDFWGNLPVFFIFRFYEDTHYLILEIFFTKFFPETPIGGGRPIGVVGFSGIKIIDTNCSKLTYYYLGFALRVGITYETPEYP